MKKVVFIFMLVLGFAWNSNAQTWTFLQDSYATFCGGNITSCNLAAGNVLPTTAGSVWIIMIHTRNNVTITAANGWTLCPASACHTFIASGVSGGSDNIDMAYRIGGPGGTTSMTVTLSGASGNFFNAVLTEILPPPGSTASYDTAGVTSSSTCTVPTCNGVGFANLAATDAVFESAWGAAHTFWNAWSAPFMTVNGKEEGLLLNAPPGPLATPTYQVTETGNNVSAIAFKSSLGVFTPPSQPISVVNYTNVNGVACGSGCSLTGTPYIGVGHLLYIEAAQLNGGFISSVSGGGTWVIPNGPNTCRINGGSPAVSTSCAYVLSSVATTSPPIVTMSNGSATSFAMWELATTGNAFTFDTQASAPRAAALTEQGVALSLNGTNDVIFHNIGVSGGTSSGSLSPLGVANNSGGGSEFLNSNASNQALLNTTNGAANAWANEQGATNPVVVSAVAFSSGTGTQTTPAPPSNLRAVAN